MKTAEEIKKAAAICFETGNCLYCSYESECEKWIQDHDNAMMGEPLIQDMLELIQQLEIERDAAQKERNALMADLQAVCGGKFRDNCIVCGNYRPDEQKEKRCILNGWICSWEWRGIQEDKPT